MTDIIVRAPRVRKPVALAPQGGGSWGAYTWGVLEALLASRSVSIAQLSGTSAGAINAAIVASVFSDERKPTLHIPANEAAFDPHPDRLPLDATRRSGG
jgi:predicted acylesterase/phospholipase RssA